MIRIKVNEGYDLSKIRSFMAKLGFQEVETPMTAIRDYSGLIVFRRDSWRIEFNYPPETLTCSTLKGNGSWCSIRWADIKSIQCTSTSLDIIEKTGNEIQLWTN